MIEVRPFWKIVEPAEPRPEIGQSIVMRPGPGWGSGAHETTQLCLQAIALLAPGQREYPREWKMLDFGSGSGVLSIAAARLGARVSGVEIDEEAIAHARENARLSGVEDRVSFSASLTLGGNGDFDLVVANILRPILLDFAPELARRVAPGGSLLLSGLVSTDIPEISVRFSSHLGGRAPETYSRGDWRALVWRNP